MPFSLESELLISKMTSVLHSQGEICRAKLDFKGIKLICCILASIANLPA